MREKRSIAADSELDLSKQELDARFSGANWIVLPATIVVGVLLAFGLHFLLVRLNQRLAFADGPAEIYQFPQTAIWWFFPVFAALTLSWEIVLQVWALIGSRHEADLYAYRSGLGVRMRGMSGSADVNTRKWLRWLGALVVLPIGILTLLALPDHVAMRSDYIRRCGYAFSTCENFDYGRARRMTKILGSRTRDGKVAGRAGIVIDFDDGRRFSTADYEDFQPDLDPAVALFLRRKTGLSIKSAETVDDIPPLDAEPQR